LVTATSAVKPPGHCEETVYCTWHPVAACAVAAVSAEPASTTSDTAATAADGLRESLGTARSSRGARGGTRTDQGLTTVGGAPGAARLTQFPRREPVGTGAGSCTRTAPAEASLDSVGAMQPPRLRPWRAVPCPARLSSSHSIESL
jgi:hypothetical protein